jgi:hypothetical protein
MSNGNGDEPTNGAPEALAFGGDPRDAVRLPDVSPEAVNARLRAFVAEFRERQARGERGRFYESDALLCAYAEDALRHVAEADAKLRAAELAEANLERAILERRGGRVQ